MPAEVDAGLATLSDQLILATVLLYIFAMIGYAWIWPSAGPRRRPRPRPRRTRARHGRRCGRRRVRPASASGAGRDRTEKAPPAWAVGPAGRGRAHLARLGRRTSASILTRGLAVDRWPWGNMYEFVVAICFAAVTRLPVHAPPLPDVRFLGAFVMVAAALGLGFAVRYSARAGGARGARAELLLGRDPRHGGDHRQRPVHRGRRLRHPLPRPRRTTAVRLPSRRDLERRRAPGHRHRPSRSGPSPSSPARSGPTRPGAATGAGTPRRSGPSSPGSPTPPTCTPGPPRAGRAEAAMIVQLVAFGCLLFNLSASTSSSAGCTPTQVP